MKRSKWLKWRIGAMASVAIVLLFHEVKVSTAFEQAYANASPSEKSVASSINQQDQTTLDDLYSQTQDSSIQNNSQPVQSDQVGARNSRTDTTTSRS